MRTCMGFFSVSILGMLALIFSEVGGDGVFNGLQAMGSAICLGLLWSSLVSMWVRLSEGLD